MPDVILRILSIIGIVLLILLGMVLLSLLLVLFWPVTYRVKGEKDTEKLSVTAKADWLFGLVRVRYAYPEPGNVVVKLLWKTLVDTGQKKEPSEKKQESGKQTENAEPEEKSVPVESKAFMETAGAEGSPEAAGPAADVEMSTVEPTANAEEQVHNKPVSRILEKIQNIKYTISKIYDKIKEIWANISYYTALLREEDTALLWKHVKLRLGNILKDIRPRHIKANVLFGTGAPDTTGYAFGVCCMLLPVLGKNICVSPDFNRKVLEGNVDVSGHITLYTLAWNALKLLLDKKLKLFIKKMKAGRKENGR
ncbi:MAG: hypothetical protein K2J60_13945 [Acetatifactor sp.]|nr:hypothetical protein [Acetatifactor sp.]